MMMMMMTMSMKTTRMVFLTAPVLMMILGGTSAHSHHGSGEANDTNDDPGIQHVEPTFFLRLIFQKYGKEEVMTFEGLEHLLDNIGLGIVTSFDHGLQSHIDETGNFVDFHGDHQHNHVTNHSHGDHSNDDRESGRTPLISGALHDRLNKSEGNISCLSAKEILKTFRIQSTGGIQTSHFLNLCPALVYQLDQHLCRSRPFLGHVHDHEVATGSFHLSPWIGAFSAVGTISMAGFFVVSIIPWIANCAFYNSLIQLLISLAVGTLTADALLHLLPHAMIPHHSDHSQSFGEVKRDGHDKHPVWVGLVTFVAILMFFLMERFLKISSDARARRSSKKSSRSRLQPKTSDGENSNHSSRPLEMIYLKTENITDPKKDGCICSIEKLKELTVHHGQCEHDSDEDYLHHHDIHHHHHHHQNDEIMPQKGGNELVEQKNRDHHYHHHGHQHWHSRSHGHSHKVPSSIASVAWMVIMGDGLHNFTDGLAIGASFSNSIPIGLSTSVAVLCHELPHELGDFAVLLRSGMSMKQALLCNLMSSVLCFLGASLGIAIGNIDSITSWVFSVTAGIFIYIALVDMLPQVTSAYELDSHDDDMDNGEDNDEERRKGQKKSSKRCSSLGFSLSSNLKHLFIHTVGITLGLALMFVIAIYEDSIAITIY